MALLQLEAARDFIMSDKLKIFNFKSEKILEFPCKDDTSNIRNVKQFIDDEESMALSDLSRIQVFWLFSALPVPDDVLVKDLLDQKAELYYLLPQLAKVQATGSGNTFILDMAWTFEGVLWAPSFHLFSGETMVFSKTKNFFGRTTEKRCLRLTAGRKPDVFRIPNRGRFAVLRNK